MGKRLGFAGDTLVDVVIVLGLTALFLLCMGYVISQIGEQKAQCTRSGGQWTRHYKSYTCVHPSPTGSR